MTLQVSVTDRKGHPVTGLQASDFTLLDNGKAVKIDSFSGLGEQAKPSEQVHAFLLVDEINTPFIGVSIERLQMQKFFRSRAHLPVPVSVAFLTDTGIQQMGPPTSDGNKLADQLNQQDSQLRVIERSAGFYGGAERMQLSVSQLQQIAAATTHMPGRKLIIWVSPGWWMFDNPDVITSMRQQRGIFADLVNLSWTLRSGHDTLFSVDPEGLYDAGSLRTMLWRDFLKPVQSARQAQLGNLALQVQAQHSGGLVLFDSNDVAGEINQCIQSGLERYRLAFQPQPGTEGITWHSLDVRVDKPGVRVLTRNGYYAAPPQK